MDQFSFRMSVSGNSAWFMSLSPVTRDLVYTFAVYAIGKTPLMFRHGLRRCDSEDYTQQKDPSAQGTYRGKTVCIVQCDRQPF